MGLLNRKKAKRGPKASSAAQEADRARRAEAARAGLTVFATVVVFGALAGGFVAGVPRMERVLDTDRPAPAAKVVFEWPQASGGAPGQTWLPQETRDELLAVAHQELDRIPDEFSAQGLQRAGEALLRTGWFERVSGVQREAGGVIHVVGMWRVPAAVVRRQNVDYLVARGGQMLPLAYQRDTSGRTAIIGAQLDPPKERGQVLQGGVWPGADVKAGLDLLTLIGAHSWRGQIVAVDVSEYLANRRLVLITRWNGRAVWGGAPGESVPGEVSDEVKLRRLDVLAKEFGQVDSKRRVVEVAGPILLVDDTATANAQ